MPEVVIWEVLVWQGPVAADGYGTLLCEIPSWQQLSIAPLGNNVGAGTIQVPLSSPVLWQQGLTPETTPVLAQETLWQCLQNGNVVFEFLAQTVDRTTVASDETATVTVSGPGTGQVLNWGMAMPQGWTPQDGGFIGLTGSIQDPFDEQLASGAYYVDPQLWNLSTPGACSVVPGTSYTYNENYEDYGTNYGLSGTDQTYFNGGGGAVEVLLTPAGAYLGGGPYVFANSSFSAMVTQPALVNLGAPGSPIDNDLTDGHDVTQMIIRPSTGTGYAMIALSYGDFWCEFEDAHGAVTRYTIGPGLVGGTGAYDSSFGQYWRISCDNTNVANQYLYRFWTSGDGAAWTLQFAMTPAAAGWNPNEANVYLGGTYDTTGTFGAYATFQSINGEISAGADLGPIYISQPAMAMVYDQLQRFAARGTIPYVTPTWTESEDSSGEAWSDTFSVQIPIGTDGLTMMTNYAGAVDASWIMNPGYLLSASVNPGRQLSDSIVFHEGEITQYGRTQTRDLIYNVAATADGAGMIWTEALPDSIGQWGQRETWVASGGAIDSQSAVNTAQAAIDQWGTEVDARVLQVPPNAYGKTLFADIYIWDWIGIERSDFSGIDPMQVIGMTVTIDQDGGEVHELILMTYKQVLAQWFLYLMNKFGGQAASTLGALTPGSTAGSAFSLAVGPSLMLAPQQLGGSGSTKATSLGPATTLAATPEVAAAQVPGAGGVIPGTIIQGLSIPASAVNFTAYDIGGGAGGINVYFQGTAPTGDIPANSLWYNTSSGNALNTYTDGVWVTYQYGAAALAVNSVTSAQIAANAVTTAAIAANAVTEGTIAAGAVTTTQIAANTITAADIAAGAITAVTIAAGAVTAAAIAANTITAGQIQASTITATQIAANTITAANIAANTITATQIAANTITATQILAGTITSVQIATGTVTASELAAGIVVSGIVNATTITGAVLSGSVFEGSDWLENSNGEYFYTGSPAAGTLMAAICNGTATGDTYGNATMAGMGVYGTGSNIGESAILSVENGPTLQMFSGAASEATGAAVFSRTQAAGQATEWVLMSIQGPKSTYDTANAGIGLNSSMKNGAEPAQGNLYYNGTAILMWGSGGVTCTALTVNGGIDSSSIHTSGIGEFDGGVQVGDTTIVSSSYAGTLGSLHVSASTGDGDVVIDETLNVGSTVTAGAFTTSGTLNVTQLSTLGGVSSVNLQTSGPVVVGTTLSVSGSSTLAGIEASSIHTSGAGEFDGGISGNFTGSLGSGVNVPAGQVSGSFGGITAASIHTSGNGEFDGTLTFGTLGTSIPGGMVSGNVAGANVASSSQACTGDCTGTWKGHAFSPAQGFTSIFPINASTCVPLTYKAVTARGVLSHDEVRPGDVTPVWNPATGAVEDAVVKDVLYHDAAKACRIGNDRWSVTCTWDHKWITDDCGLVRADCMEPGTLKVHLGDGWYEPVEFFEDLGILDTFCLSTTTGTWTAYRDEKTAADEGMAPGAFWTGNSNPATPWENQVITGLNSLVAALVASGVVT